MMVLSQGHGNARILPCRVPKSLCVINEKEMQNMNQRTIIAVWAPDSQKENSSPRLCWSAWLIVKV